MVREMKRSKVNTGTSASYERRRVLIEAVRSIWGRDSEMVYLVLWMWGGDEAARVTSPEEARTLLALAAAGPDSGYADSLRDRLRVLHEIVYPELSLAA